MGLLIQNGTLVDPRGRCRGDVLVEDGAIAAVGQHLPAAGAEVYDAAGQYVLPGLIDAHVHFRDPGMTHKEDFATGSRAAIHGGVTAVLDMPNVVPVTSTRERLLERMAAARERCAVNIRFFALLTEDNLPELEGMWEAGAVGFKLFLGTSTGNVACPSDGVLLQQFRRAADLGARIAIHAENNGINAYYTKYYQDLGRTDPAVLPLARPAFSEVEAVGKAIAFARETGAKIHICHVSTAAGAALIRRAKEEGLDVTCETAPQYLLLSDRAYEEKGPIIKAYPTIKSEADRLGLWEAVRDGTIDFIATDHAPHTREEKQGNIWTVTGGVSGVEIALPLLLTEVNQGHLTLEQVARLMAEGPARVWNLAPWGAIRPGAPTNLTVADLDRSWVIDEAKLHGKNNVTAFAGTPVRGAAAATVVNGRLYRLES